MHERQISATITEVSAAHTTKQVGPNKWGVRQDLSDPAISSVKTGMEAQRKVPWAARKNRTKILFG